MQLTFQKSAFTKVQVEEIQYNQQNPKTTENMFSKTQNIISQPSNIPGEINEGEDSQRPNYYVQSMKKILKKCPYNGHTCCDCKKCKCIRRNRQSAKMSQDKKRNAVEQLSHMQEKIYELQKKNYDLQKRNHELQQMNNFLMAFFKSVKSNPALQPTLQPMNKIIGEIDQ